MQTLKVGTPTGNKFPWEAALFTAESLVPWVVSGIWYSSPELFVKWMEVQQHRAIYQVLKP